MYFQSYGAVSIIKVKAHWFHVRERGVFGAIFGTLISFGVYFAFDWGQADRQHDQSRRADADWAWSHADPARFSCRRPDRWMRRGRCFSFPPAILFVWALLDIWLIKDTPEDAGFPHLDTHDASSGHMHEEYTTLDLLKKVFLNPLMLMFAVRRTDRRRSAQRHHAMVHDLRARCEADRAPEFILEQLGTAAVRVRHRRRIRRRADLG